MPIPRPAVVTLLVSAAGMVVTAALAACERPDAAPQMDTTSPAGRTSAPVDSPVQAVSSGWDTRAGPVLLIAGDRPDAAIVILPELQGEQAAVDIEFDPAAVRDAAVTLIARSGLVGSASLGGRTTSDEDEEDDCIGWPMLRVLGPAGALASPIPWTVGLIRSRLVPVPLDSVESLAPRDSATLVAEVTRLASAIPERTAAARLRGLPFSVEDVRWFRVPPNVDVIVAHVVRRIHQEANPLEERTLLIAERDSTQRREQHPERYTLAFERRTAGREETLEGSELLAALTARDTRQPILVFARESEGGVRYVLLGRVGARDWRVKWTSALVRC